MRAIALKALVNILVMIYALDAQASDTFTWINTNDNPQVLNEIKTAFADELQPDNPEKVKPVVPYFYKYISSLGAFHNTRLVIIGYREHESDKPEFDYFRAFSYDVARHIKQEIEPSGYYYRWSFLTQASFELSSTPDVVFKSYNCLECESVELLSSFRFDAKENLWKRRIWPDNDPDLMIDSNRQFGDDDNSLYDCLYKIMDFNSDHFADIAIRCRQTGETSRKVIKDELLLYTIQKGVAKRIQIREKKKFDNMSNILCEGQDSPLCKHK
jgi:hypothetical protein